ncbi:unnamed protein product [Protopolystoma xenopodis]|uniref:Uncharacterized protein n=1 Tax=Protopolystoma xenopodis TaxID=117903 RepID=A0A448WED6_9PLAT|nr:unnamed protein product [Protopolystoma xenopodis]
MSCYFSTVQIVCRSECVDLLAAHAILQSVQTRIDWAKKDCIFFSCISLLQPEALANSGHANRLYSASNLQHLGASTLPSIVGGSNHGGGSRPPLKPDARLGQPIDMTSLFMVEVKLLSDDQPPLQIEVTVSRATRLHVTQIGP